MTVVALDTMLIDFGPMQELFLFETKNLNKYACDLSKCEERNATAIVSQIIDIKKDGRKIVARSRKIQIGTPAKEVPVLSKNKLFLLIPVKA